MRRSMLRWRRRPAWSVSRRCRNSRCERPLFSASLAGGVELLGRHRDTQGGEVGEDLLTQAWGRLSGSSGSSSGFAADGVSSQASSGKSKC